MNKDMFFVRKLSGMAMRKHTMEHDDSTCHVHHHVSEPLGFHAAKVGRSLWCSMTFITAVLDGSGRDTFTRPETMFQTINFLFLLLALLAEVVGTIGGFGSSVFFVPFANFFFDFHAVLGITAIFHLASNISKIALFRHGIDRTLLINIGVPSVIFVIIGGLLTRFLATTWLELALAIFLISLALLFLIKSELVIPPKRLQSIIGGSLSGFAAGLLGTGGAIRGLTMAAFNLEKSVFIATSAAIDLAIDLSRTVVYVANGFVLKEHLIYLPFLFVIGFAGTYIGRYLLTYMPQQVFKTISLVLILLIGLVTLGKVLLDMHTT
jgi:uncharacterized protein